jgi:hypothetical protein
MVFVYHDNKSKSKNKRKTNVTQNITSTNKDYIGTNARKETIATN